MFVLLGFAAQVCVFLSITAIVISCIPSPISVTLADSDEPDATLSDTASDCLSYDELADLEFEQGYSALSMASPVYVTTIDEQTVSPDDLSSLTVKQLKSLCKQRGIKRYSNLRKHELIALLQH